MNKSTFCKLREVFLTLSFIGGFLFTVENAGAANRAGVIVLIKGDVFILDTKANIVADPQGRRGRTTKIGAEFFEGETISTKVGARVKLRFDEGGNEIVLGSDTTLLIERAGAGGTKKGTSLNLSKGEVRSDVKIRYSGEGAEVYEVKSKNAVAGVRGTIFVAILDKNQNFTVATERGSVFVQSTGMNRRGAGIYFVNAGKFVKSSPEGIEAPKPISSNPELKATIDTLGGAGTDKSDPNQSSSQSNQSDASESRDNKQETEDRQAASENEKGERKDVANNEDKGNSKESSMNQRESDENDGRKNNGESKESLAENQQSGDGGKKSDSQNVASREPSDNRSLSDSKKAPEASAPESVQDVATTSPPPLGQETVLPTNSGNSESGAGNFKSGSGADSANAAAARGTGGARTPANAQSSASGAGKSGLMIPGGSNGEANRGVYMGPPPVTAIPSYISDPAKSALDNASSAQKTYINDKATNSQTGTVKVIIR